MASDGIGSCRRGCGKRCRTRGQKCSCHKILVFPDRADRLHSLSQHARNGCTNRSTCAPPTSAPSVAPARRSRRGCRPLSASSRPLEPSARRGRELLRPQRLRHRAGRTSGLGESDPRPCLGRRVVRGSPSPRDPEAMGHCGKQRATSEARHRPHRGTPLGPPPLLLHLRRLLWADTAPRERLRRFPER